MALDGEPAIARTHRLSYLAGSSEPQALPIGGKEEPTRRFELVGRIKVIYKTEQDLFIGHSVTSARDLREIFRKIWTGEHEHSRFLTAFAEAISFADSENFYALAPAALLLVDRYRILATYAHQVLDADDPEPEHDSFSGLRIEPHLATPAAKVCVWYRSGKWCATIFANTSQGKMTVAHEDGVHISVIKRGEGPLEPR